MQGVLEFALLGLGTGAIYALLAQGIVLIFRGSGIVNLAHGAIAMVSAYVFLHLRQGGWSIGTDMVASVAVAVGISILIDQVVLRYLRRASSVTRLIATLGVLLVLQALGTIWWGSTTAVVLPIFTIHQINIFGATMGSDRLILLVVALVVTASLTVVLKYTKLGWAIEAVSENQRAVAAQGRSPELISSITWAVGGALAGLAGILVSPITQLTVSGLTLIVISGLAAALLGGFRSFPLTLLGGLLLGVVEAEAGQYVHIVGAAQAIPLLLIIAILVLGGSALPLRGHIFDRLPSVGVGRINLRVVAPVFVIVVVILSLVTSPNWLATLSGTFAAATILLSLVVLTGYGGQVSLAQYALAGIGALVAAQLARGSGWSLPPALLAGMVSATLVGLIFALPALRTRGVNLAVVTLALGAAVQAVFFDNPKYVGNAGVAVGPQRIFGWDVSPLTHDGRYTVVVFVLFCACALIVANVRRSGTGRRLLAVRANERAAAASGINVFSTKLKGFAISGALAGIGGTLFAFRQSPVTFDTFDPITSIHAVAEAVVGGIGYVVGPVLGSLLDPSSISVIISLSWSGLETYLPLIGGVAVLLTVIIHPNGVMSVFGPLLKKAVSPFLKLDRAETIDFSGLQPQQVSPRTLTVEKLTVRYGGVVAVSDVALTVGPGEVVGLIGPNGAGKTSVLDAVSGFASSNGEIRLDGEAISEWSPHRRATGGLVRSFQALELFEDMTVFENLKVAGEKSSLRNFARDLVSPAPSELSPAAVAAVREFGLTGILHRLPEELPFGQRRMVAVARAIAQEPSVLLLDEPVSGLDTNESREFARLVRGLADRWGMGILVVEHDMDFVMDICDRIQVMNFGVPICSGTPDEVRTNPSAIAAYLGIEEPVSPTTAHEVTP